MPSRRVGSGIVAGLHVTETVDGAAVVVDVGAGLSVGPTGAPLPVVEATLTVDGWGLRLRSQPRFTLELLRPAPATPIELYPESPGVGSVISDVGTSLVPVVLNALAAHRNDAGSGLVKDTGAAVYELGDALAIMEGPVGSRQFTAGLITTFVSRPTSLVERIPALASAGLGELAHALDPTGRRRRHVGAAERRASVSRSATTGAIHLDIGSRSHAVDRHRRHLRHPGRRRARAARSRRGRAPADHSHRGAGRGAGGARPHRPRLDRAPPDGGGARRRVDGDSSRA